MWVRPMKPTPITPTPTVLECGAEVPPVRTIEAAMPRLCGFSAMDRFRWPRQMLYDQSMRRADVVEPLLPRFALDDQVHLRQVARDNIENSPPVHRTLA